MNDARNCALCNRTPTDGVQMGNAGSHSSLWVTCPLCGRYELIGPFAATHNIRWSKEVRQALSCATRQASESGRTLKISSLSDGEDLARPHMNTRVVENQERLLQEMAKRAQRPDGAATFNPTTDFTLIDCYSQTEFEWYLGWIEIQKLAFTTATGPTSRSYTLSLDGWNMVQPLPRPGGIPGRCFVAMWFSEETQKAYDLGIEPAIKEAGCKPVRIDQKEHNNEITDEIMAEIRNSQFIVADFTGQRAGVYYEAGFAMGLGRPVIWCCRKDDVDKLHFDTNHKNHIVWESAEELKQKLYTRIRGTILQQA
jgi:hypothetical protein